MTPRALFDAWFDKTHHGLPWEPEREHLWAAWQAGAESATGSTSQSTGLTARLPASAIEGHLMAKAASSKISSVERLESDITPETIYAAYPRKVGKQAALKAIRKALVRPKGVDLADGDENWQGYILAKVKAFADAVAKWPAEDKKFIPHPATWFNRGSYDDDPQEWVRGNAQKSQFANSYR